MNRILYQAAFIVGLIAVGWVGFGYLASNPLALTMTAIIGAFYVMGALELRRFQQATDSLDRALAAIPNPLTSLGDWLIKLHASLQNPVRLRIEGARTGLPGPAMTPYLAGLLVLLGMLGTFLGMVVTLNGTAIALESTTDLQAIRASLAAPVKGLGLAFGTSVAGVAASAMLGLMSALCRRERLQAAQSLDSSIATRLRAFTPAHQREESFKTLQSQAGLMPELIDRLQAMMAQLERQSQQSNERLIAGQEGFYRHAEASYAGLAAAVDRSLEKSLTESARTAGATIRPVVEATMAGIARETTALHDKVAHTVTLQLDALAGRFGTTVDTVAQTWTTVLARHERTSDDLAQGLQASLGRFNETFDQGAASLMAGVAKTHGALQADLATAMNGMARETHALHERMASSVSAQLDGVSARFDSAVGDVSATWRDALAQHESGSEKLSAEMQRALQSFTENFEQRSAALVQKVDASHAGLQAELTSRDEQRLAAWSGSLESMAATLQTEWQQAGVHAFEQQQRICQALEQTAQDIATQAEAQARGTLAEITGLMDAAAQAPRAAAEVIGQLRDKLFESMARDNEVLEERSRIMATLRTLLDAVNHASTEQRAAIDSLVSASSAMLERAGTRFTDKVDAESGKMNEIATRLSGSAAEVSSLGEAFGFGVQLFSESNDKLMSQLERIESSLGKSVTRSDEQLAYYVAQAREIIDLSIMSQKQIIDDLQRVASRQAALAIES